ncbi:MAG: phosphoesterase [Planctomycetota bacterium]
MPNAANEAATEAATQEEVAQEQVLVVPTEVFHSLGHFQGFSGDVERYLPALLECGELSYQPRGEMELDPSHKQLIPYVVFRHRTADGGPTIFTYRRGAGGGEARLRAKRSVGVGGHISIVDAHAAAASGDVYRQGLERELAEEVAIDSPYRESCIGLINDDATDVGRVHLGVVHVFDLDGPRVSPREEDIADPRFEPLEQVANDLDAYESWSQIAVEALVAGA